MLLGVARTKQNFGALNYPTAISNARAVKEIVSNECISKYICESDVLVKKSSMLILKESEMMTHHLHSHKRR